MKLNRALPVFAVLGVSVGSYVFFSARKSASGTQEFVSLEVPIKESMAVGSKAKAITISKSSREVANEKPLSNFENLKAALRARIASRRMPKDSSFFEKQYIRAFDAHPELEKMDQLTANRFLCRKGVALACSMVGNHLSNALNERVWRKEITWEEATLGTPEIRETLAIYCMETGKDCDLAYRTNRKSEVGDLLLSLGQENCSMGVPTACANVMNVFYEKLRNRAPASEDEVSESDQELKKQMLEIANEHCSTTDLSICSDAIAVGDKEDSAVQRAKATYAAACIDGNDGACARNARLLLRDGEVDSAAAVASAACENKQGTACLSVAAVDYYKTNDLESLRPGLAKFCELESVTRGGSEELCNAIRSPAALTKSIFNAHYSAQDSGGGEGAPLDWAITGFQPQVDP